MPQWETRINYRGRTGGPGRRDASREEGLDVTVIERASEVGGRTSSIRAEGFTFDTGPNFFFTRSARRDLHPLRAQPPTEVDLIRLDPQYRIIFGAGGELRATGDMARMEREIARISPPDAPAFRRFMDDNRRKFNCLTPASVRLFTDYRTCSMRTS